VRLIGYDRVTKTYIYAEKAKRAEKRPRKTLDLREWTPEQKKARQREQEAKWRRLNPAKASARQAVKEAVRAGRLERLPCKMCGNADATDGHHTDYSRPLGVVWLCKPCHREEHRRMKADDLFAGL
jgi:hypothetical protein